MVPIARTLQTLGGTAGIAEAGDGDDDPDVPDARGSLGLEGKDTLSNAGNARLCAETEPLLRRASPTRIYGVPGGCTGRFS